MWIKKWEAVQTGFVQISTNIENHVLLSGELT
jgi:hypothetical protein